MKKFLPNWARMALFSLLFFSGPSLFAQAPTEAAPTPICDQADVISMFSNAYTDVPVDTWLTPWSPPTTTLTDLQIGGNDTKFYENVDFLGIEMFGTPIDASGMTYFNVSIWTEDMTTFRVKLVDFSGPTTEGEIAFTPTQSGWNTFSIPMADFANPSLVTGPTLQNTTLLSQLIFSGLPTGAGSFYVDNIYFSTSACPTAAPEPTCDAADVISMFSNAYTDVPVDTWLTPWSPPTTTLTDLQIGGNDTKFYENVDFLGIEMFGFPIDASAMTTFNVDVWTADMTTFRVKLVDFSGATTEGEIAFTPTQLGWNTFSIPMADFANPSLVTGPTLQNSTQLSQLIFSGLPTNAGSFYVDNIYFSTCGPADLDPCSGNVAIENLANGMDYTIVSDAAGNVDITLTVVDNPAGLVGFLNGGPISFPAPGTSTFTYSLTGQDDPFVLDMFFNWAGVGGQGNSETVTASCEAAPVTTEVTFCVDLDCNANGDAASVFGSFNGWNPGANMVTDPDGDGVYCTTIALIPGEYEFLYFTAATQAEVMNEGDDCTVTNFGFTNRTLTVGTEPIMLMNGFETCDAECTPVPMTQVDLCVDLSCFPQVDAASVYGAFNGWNPGANFLSDADGDGVYCTSVMMEYGDQEYLFFFAQEQGEIMTPGDPCTTTNFGFTNRLIVVGETPLAETHLWESCETGATVDAVCEAITVQLDDEGNGSIASADNTSSQIDGGSTGTCGGLTFSESMTEFNCENVGANTVTLTVTDASGNMSTCDATVTVEDNVPPVITVTPQTVVLSDDDGTATLTVADLASATDACGIASLTASQLLFTCEDIGEVEVTITVTDNNGNISTSPVTVTVEFNQPELACIGEINLTLNEDCQALLIPRMVLVGNVACLDVFNWDIVVQDDDPSNGPIIDGCGSFTYSISPSSNGDEPTEGFTGDFAPENWFGISATFPNPPNFPGPLSDDQLTSATFTDDELVMTTQALVFNTGVSFGIQQVLMFSEAGELNFDYNFNGVDAGFDDAISLVTFEGFNIVAIPFNTDMPESGSVTLDIEPGYTLNFLLRDDGFQPLAPNTDLPSVLTISNFLFTPPTSIFDLDFETCWGIVNAEDKTSPVADIVPANVSLLCVDFEANDVSTLPATVSKCYLVDGQTGATDPSSMAPALRARLLAGGLSPVVPTFTDGCAQQLEVCVSDVVAYGDDPDCDDIVITRTFVASEVSTCVSAAGEENAPAVASYTITFERPTLADLDAGSFNDVVNVESCGADSSVRPAPSQADYPRLQVGDRTFILDGESICNLGLTYSDGPAIVTCAFTYKFVRTYTVIDWCDPSDVRTFTQVVKVGDTTAPNFTGPSVPTNAAGDLVYGTNAGNICAAYLRLDDVSATDNCSGTNVSISAEIFPGGDDTGAPIGAFDVVPGGSPELSSAIPAGRHLLRYTTSDQCGNTVVNDYFFVVEDQTPPAAICEDGLNISLASAGNNSGFAVLTPANIDNGSYDDCSAVSMSIARVNSANLPIGNYGPQVTLTCSDVGSVRVGLRVEDASGNVNYCWLDVLVEDKIAPVCVAPASTSISCVDYNFDMPADIQEATDAQLDAAFGAAAAFDNCGAAITQRVSGDVNSCGVGTFTRVFTATDDAGLTNVSACTQRIDVIGIHDYRLTFPTDESGDCAEIPVYAGVGVDEFGCDLVTTTTNVDTLRTLDAGDECFKLRVTYDVVNWCEYNTLGDPIIVTRDGSGVNNRQRLPRNIDNDVLYVNVIANDLSGTGDDQAFMTLFGDRVYSPNAPQRDREFADYAGSDSRGFFRYTQFIKIYDEVAPEVSFTALEECFAGAGEGCRTTVSIEFTATDDCSDVIVGVELDANYVVDNFSPDNAGALGVGVSVDNDGAGNYTVTATNVPVGEHALRVRAADGCGNFDVKIIEFCVTADRTPTPICIQTLTVVLMDDGNGGGTAAIWASDFIASPIQDCFGNDVTKYSLFRSSDAGAAGFVPTFDPPATDGIADIDCDDAAAGTVSVRIYAFDDNGNTPDYCEVVVEVQDNMGHCDDGGTGNVAGLIADQDDVAVENVSVTLTGAMDMTTTTDANGQFSFTGLPLNADYTVQPAYDAPVNLRNVKSSDLVAMIGQILGTTTFDSPYDFVAADVNRDMELNIFDVVNASQVILGQVDLFDGGTTWVFVDVNATIEVANPYAATFPEVHNANDLAGNITANFVAVEVGNPFGLSSRTALNLKADDAQLEAGQTHTLVLDGSALAAFQGTIELAAGLELVSADYAGEGAINLDRAAEGLIAVALRDNAILSLEVRATEAGLLSELVSLTDAITVREGVTAAGISNGLALNFSGVVATDMVNMLEQNSPNPVADVTTIAYTLATAGQVTLNIQDVQGRTIMVRELEGIAGRNVTTVNVNELGATTGIFSYTLTAGDYSATKKMVVVR